MRPLLFCPLDRILPLIAISALAAAPMPCGADTTTNQAAITKACTATAGLLQKFNRNAWAAQKAHDEAVRIGAPILPDLIAAAAERTRPASARMWLVTAIADIADPQSVSALVTLLDDPDADIRAVAGYFGPKQKSAPLDQAIIAKAGAAQNARFTAYALLGFLTFRGEAPEGLLKAGLESDDPRARTTAAQALATMASESSKSRLQALLQDKDERVRTTARKALDAMTPTKQAPTATIP